MYRLPHIEAEISLIAERCVWVNRCHQALRLPAICGSQIGSTMDDPSLHRHRYGLGHNGLQVVSDVGQSRQRSLA